PQPSAGAARPARSQMIQLARAGGGRQGRCCQPSPQEAPYSGVGPTNAVPRAALATVSQTSRRQCRLTGFPVGNSCKINGSQQNRPHDQEKWKTVTNNRRANSGQSCCAP